MTDAMERTEAIVKKGKSLGADDVIARTTLSRRTQIRFSNNEIDISKVWNDYSTEVVLTWQKRVVATEIKNFERIEEKTERVLQELRTKRQEVARIHREKRRKRSAEAARE